MFLVFGRYADVTATALFGRDINLYWDLRFIPDVVSLLAKAAHVWLVLGVSLAGVLVIAVLYVALRWALGRVADAAHDTRERIAIAIAAVLVIVPGLPVARPVTLTYARQLRVAVRAISGSTTVPQSPAMTSNLSRVKGADVYLIFLESYGAVTFDRPEFAAASRRAAPRSRRPFETRIATSSRRSSSRRRSAATSWLAHISLMSGVEVRDPDVNAMLMAQKRDTIVTNFARQGYRTIALMPGLWQAWPEGTFYGSTRSTAASGSTIAARRSAGSTSPTSSRSRSSTRSRRTRRRDAPLFMFFPTISTHTPFRPTPPYQPDWTRVLTEQPFDQPDLDRSFDAQADWLNLGPSYVDAMAYTYATLSGYLRTRADRDFVMILLGDHQPPALVSGEGAPWDVPVHVIASRRDVLDRAGREGIPPRPHAVTP